MKAIIADRRALHRIPELDRELDRTMAYLHSILRKLRCRVFAPIPNALCAYFDNDCDGTIAFRTGCDALPVQEATFLPYASQISGHMHACGHDGHMAMLLELARRMHACKARRNILLIFQPAEETTGGARDICKSGVFEKYNVEAVFGIHLWPDLPLGTVASRKNEMMSRSCEVNVNITGKACSVSRMDEGIDALRAGMEFYRQAVAAEAAYPDDIYRLMHFGHMESGCQCNVVSDRTRMEGTLRAFQDDVFFGILDSLEASARTISEETGCKIQIETSMGYPAVMNPPELYDHMRAIGVAFSDLESPVMLTEDFSWYQRHLPGMFFFLGTGPSPALQAADFTFDESVLDTGADFLESIAMRYEKTKSDAHDVRFD